MNEAGELLTDQQWELLEPLLPRPTRRRDKRGRPRQKPRRVIAERGYDSDPLRERLQQRGKELIAPYRTNN